MSNIFVTLFMQKYDKLLSTIKEKPQIPLTKHLEKQSKTKTLKCVTQLMHYYLKQSISLCIEFPYTILEWHWRRFQAIDALSLCLVIETMLPPCGSEKRWKQIHATNVPARAPNYHCKETNGVIF